MNLGMTTIRLAHYVLRQKENAPKGMDASKMNAPKVAQNMAGMQAYLGEQEWMCEL